jgi:hypothetical protein
MRGVVPGAVVAGDGDAGIGARGGGKMGLGGITDWFQGQIESPRL